MSLTAADSSADQGSSYLLFALLCLVWGSTWLALKRGVGTVPPLTYAAARFLLASLPLLGWAALRGRLQVPAATVVPGAGLMIAVNYGLMSWGITRVTGGVAAVINLATMPAAALVLGVVHGQTRWSLSAVAGVSAGAAGLLMLFGPRFGTTEAGGMAAIALGAVAWAWGALLTKRRPAADPVALAGWQSLAGGMLLAIAAPFVEPVGLAPLFTPAALGNLAFLVVAGSVVGGAAYLTLLARWDAARASAYAFVCPLIALAEEAILEGALPTRAERHAAALLMVATLLSLSARTGDRE
jgi:drug/metabolite transporter (DMT)-like permease